MNLEKLLELHTRAVKAAQRWEAATPGTVTKTALESRWERAEAAFKAALERAMK